MSHDFEARDLYAAWINLVAPYCDDPTATLRAYDDLVARYGESHRIYHNLHHVRQMIALVQEFRLLSPTPALVELAVWFHDAVYDPHATDNEERSADYADEALSRLRVPLTDQVRPLILATKTHDNLSGDLDCQLLLDADLAILGAQAEEYDRYAVAIRMEYAWVSEEEYVAGRGKALKSFLERERIYGLPPIRGRLEAQARRNLTRELGTLKT